MKFTLEKASEHIFRNYLRAKGMKKKRRRGKRNFPYRQGKKNSSCERATFLTP
jgi:hypothetical protein